MTTSLKNVVNHRVKSCGFAAIVFASSKFVAHMLMKSSNLDSAQCSVNFFDPTMNKSRILYEESTDKTKHQHQMDSSNPSYAKCS